MDQTGYSPRTRGPASHPLQTGRFDPWSPSSQAAPHSPTGPGLRPSAADHYSGPTAESHGHGLGNGGSSAWPNASIFGHGRGDETQRNYAPAVSSPVRGSLRQSVLDSRGFESPTRLNPSLDDRGVQSSFLPASPFTPRHASRPSVLDGRSPYSPLFSPGGSGHDLKGILEQYNARKRVIRGRKIAWLLSVVLLVLPFLLKTFSAPDTPSAHLYGYILEFNRHNLYSIATVIFFAIASVLYLRVPQKIAINITKEEFPLRNLDASYFEFLQRSQTKKARVVDRSLFRYEPDMSKAESPLKMGLVPTSSFAAFEENQGHHKSTLLDSVAVDANTSVEVNQRQIKNIGGLLHSDILRDSQSLGLPKMSYTPGAYSPDHQRAFNRKFVSSPLAHQITSFTRSSKTMSLDSFKRVFAEHVIPRYIQYLERSEPKDGFGITEGPHSRLSRLRSLARDINSYQHDREIHIQNQNALASHRITEARLVFEAFSNYMNGLSSSRFTSHYTANSSVSVRSSSQVVIIHDTACERAFQIYDRGVVRSSVQGNNNIWETMMEFLTKAADTDDFRVLRQSSSEPLGEFVSSLKKDA